MQTARNDVAAATVLVVDDDALLTLNAVDMIEDLGHIALEAYSGQQALDILASGQPVDVLMTDYAMPGMTGVVLASKARELRPELPVLLTTGYADLPDGITSDLPRLPKPYQLDELAEQLSRLLAARPVPAS